MARGLEASDWKSIQQLRKGRINQAARLETLMGNLFHHVSSELQAQTLAEHLEKRTNLGKIFSVSMWLSTTPSSGKPYHTSPAAKATKTDGIPRGPWRFSRFWHVKCGRGTQCTLTTAFGSLQPLLASRHGSR